MGGIDKSRNETTTNSTRSRTGVALVLVAIAGVASLVIAICMGESLDGLLLNLGTEVLGGVVLYLVFERLIGAQEARSDAARQLAERKRTLIHDLSSRVPAAATRAAEELEREGWLKDGSLRGAALGGAYLHGLDLAAAKLEGAILNSADLAGAALDYARLKGANLALADLGGANLSFADLADANLASARLNGANLTGARLNGANLTRAYLDGAKMSYVTLAGARGVTDAQLARAARLQGATMPRGVCYNGRFSLPGDLERARATGVDPLHAPSIAEFYGVATVAYEWGQRWRQWCDEPPSHSSPHYEEWEALRSNPDAIGIHPTTPADVRARCPDSVVPDKHLPSRQPAGPRSPGKSVLSQITSRQAILDAVAEFDQIGREAFLKKYGFARSRRYFLDYNRRLYDSKPILGAAYAYQYPGEEPLGPYDFHGGADSVKPKLEKLGFKVLVGPSGSTHLPRVSDGT